MFLDGFSDKHLTVILTYLGLTKLNLTWPFIAMFSKTT